MRKNQPVQIVASLRDALMEQAARTAPRECCGLLLGAGQHINAIVPAANMADDPLRHFEIDPQALIDAHRAARGGGPQVLGYYHSHPTGIAAPSATDRAMAAGDGMIWAIVAAGDVAFWRDDEAGFTPLAVPSVAG